MIKGPCRQCSSFLLAPMIAMWEWKVRVVLLYTYKQHLNILFLRNSNKQSEITSSHVGSCMWRQEDQDSRMQSSWWSMPLKSLQGMALLCRFHDTLTEDSSFDISNTVQIYVKYERMSASECECIIVTKQWWGWGMFGERKWGEGVLELK